MYYLTDAPQMTQILHRHTWLCYGMHCPWKSYRNPLPEWQKKKKKGWPGDLGKVGRSNVLMCNYILFYFFFVIRNLFSLFQMESKKGNEDLLPAKCFKVLQVFTTSVFTVMRLQFWSWTCHGWTPSSWFHYS